MTNSMNIVGAEKSANGGRVLANANLRSGGDFKSGNTNGRIAGDVCFS